MIKQLVDCGLNTKTCCALDELGYSQLGTALILTLTGGTAVLGLVRGKLLLPTLIAMPQTQALDKLDSSDQAIYRNASDKPW